MFQPIRFGLSMLLLTLRLGAFGSGFQVAVVDRSGGVYRGRDPRD